jgi:hypothetical protein
MRRSRWTILLWLTGSLAVSGCAVPGDFCDVVTGPIAFAAGTASQIVATDRDMAELIDVQNGYGRKYCPGAAWRD